VTRVLSGAALLLVAVAAVWYAPPLVFFAVAETVVVLGTFEYAALARAGRLQVPVAAASASAALTAAAFAPAVVAGSAGLPVDVMLMAAVVALGMVTMAGWRGGADALPSAAAALFPSLYLGLPIGAMMALRESGGPAVLFLLMMTVVASDTAQYYAGRALGRRRLAPAISPQKTVEGAIGGFAAGALVMAAAGTWWLPAMPAGLRALLGVGLVAMGLAGDLFESMLKRSAGVKDSSALIPGHGGVLDRIDALLFAAPVYYVVLKYL
jgi:phosphatidate cytidylyltransferase